MELSYFLKFSYLVTDLVKSRRFLLYTLIVNFEFFFRNPLGPTIKILSELENFPSPSLPKP